MRRRDLLKTTALTFAGLSAPSLGAATSTQSEVKTLGKPEKFDYAWLKGQARHLASQPYQAPPDKVPSKVKQLDWDQYQSISYRNDHALWGDERLRFQLKFFHLGMYATQSVTIHEVHDGKARVIAYDPAMFNYGKSGLAGSDLPKDLGFAGFRINFHTDLVRDIVAFLGASYFRAVGGDWQYGLSARGLAIDTGMPRPEEFPRFSAFWLERPARQSSTLAVYALLDSPSITGAYRFLITPGATTVMDVDVALYPRKPIERLGIAPLTSMFMTGENDKRISNDWRPEIHDSDGLSMLTGASEWIWRPLVNPAQLRFNAYADNSPRGFGLMQRDRNFDHYQDDGVFYERRPSLWVEPKGNWGKGSVQLVEIPTPDETFDNIVAFWNPETKPQPGEECLFSYRLHWGRKMPALPDLATVVATRTGIGGVIGKPRSYFSWRFAIDFAGGDLGLLGKDTKVEPVISTTQGTIEIPSARPLHEISGYRAIFDVRVADDHKGPVDLRLYLRADGQTLTETWLYQWTPPDDRRF
ncbi:glucan biosynthesis protein [uncultured Oxalicibacterium sp.]|uniref:glucan biosynthesis protein n=1 Tax=uncultured Oxalicibacterium sp. TaxID=1168540 RepID=UPI0025FA90D6|nr:glucan biosynthesis protein D [uncultured Oxalicibacterium sp.]